MTRTRFRTLIRKGRNLCTSPSPTTSPPGIAAGELQPGARLPPERDLATGYGVAYLTVRRAAQVLRERELIVTVHGKGTFVADPLPGAS